MKSCIAFVLMMIFSQAMCASYQTQKVYRGWNSNNGDHFYALSTTLENAVRLGYTPEGVAFCYAG